MSIIYKSMGIAMVAVVLCLFVGKQNKDIAVLISIAACCIILFYAANYLEAVLAFVSDLTLVANLEESFLQILLKSVGIGLIAEITSLLCADAGNAALGKTVQIMAVCGILWTALPLFTSLIDLMSNIIGEV